MMSYVYYGYDNKDIENRAVSQISEQEEEIVPVPQTFTLAFVGDVLLHGSIHMHAAVGDGVYDFTPFFRYVKEDLQQADLAICHLETLIAGEEGVYSRYPRFQAPHQIADALSEAGFDGCSLASNHAADGGAGSVRETVRHFERVGLQHTGVAGGVGGVSPALYRLGEKQIAHFSYTYGTNGIPVNGFSVNHIEAETIRNDVRTFLQEHGNSFIILSLHWGDEYQSEISEYQKNIITELQDSDIDLIVGHHSHVVQPIVREGEMHILAGLGNFLSAQIARLCNCPEEAQDGVIALVTVTENGSDLFVTDISLIPTIVDFYDFSILRTEKDRPTKHVSGDLMKTSAQRTRSVMERYLQE